uniref:Vacuolar protein sorting-associated protein 13 VPS13 adaptor binding domain-containing protein n=1 Tax=Amorphochlora amoebiformis TaxID=1561963 RepID=A0A7S0DJL2_9EUKA
MGDEQEMKAQVDVAGEYYDRRQVAWTPMLPRLKAIVRIKRQSGTPPVISINIQLQEPIKLRLESQLVATLVSLVDILTSDARAQVIPETRKFHRRIIRNQTGRDIWFWSSGVDPICVKHDQEAPVEDPQLIARSDSNILMKRSTSILEKHSRACQVSLQVSGYMPIEKITLHGVSRTLLSLTPSTQSHSKTSLLMDVCPHHGSHLVTLKPTLSIRNKTSAFLVLRMQRVASPSVYFDLLIEPTKTARVPLEFSDWDILHVAIRAKPGKRGRAKTPTLPSSPGRKDRWGKRSRSTSRVSDWGKRSRSRSPSTIKRKGGDPSSSNESTRDKPTKARVYRWLKPEIRWDNLAKEAQRHETRSLPFYLTTGTFFDRKNGKDKSTSNTQMSTTKIASANMECTLRATIKYAALSTLEKRSVPGKAKKEEMWATPTDLILESAFRIRNQCPRTLEAKIRLSDRSKGPSKVDKVIKVGSSSYKDVVNLVFSPHVAISLRLPPYRWSSWIPIDAFTSGEVLKLDKSRTKRFNFPKFIKEDRDHEKEKVKRMLWYVESEGQVASPRRSRSPRSSPGNNSATGGRFTAGLVSVDQKVNSHGQSQLIISTEYRLNNRTQFHAQWVRFISGYQIQMLLHNNQWGQTEDIDMLLPSRCWRWEGGTTAEPEWSYAKSRNAFSWKSKVFRGARYRRRPIRRLCSLVGLGADESKESAEERAWHRGADGTLPRALHTSLPVQKWHYVSLRLIPIAGSNDRKRNFSPLRMIGPTKISDPLDLKRAIGDGLVRLQCRMQVRDRPAGKTKEDTQRIIRGYLDIVVSVRAGQGYLSLTKKLNVSIRTMVNSKAFGALVQLRQRDSPMLSYPWLANGDEVPMYWIEPNEPQHVCLVVHEQGTDRVFQSQAFALDQVGDKILRVHNGVDLRVMRICVGESDGVMEVSIEYEPVDEPLYVIENNTPHVMQVRQNIKQRMMDKMRRERSRERKQGCGNWYGAWTWILPRQRVVWGWDDLLQPQPYKLDIMLGDTKKVVTMDNIGWSNVMKLKVKKQNKVNLSVIARGVSKVMLAQLADMPWHAVGSVKGTCKMDLRLGIDVGELSIVLGSQNSGLLAELLLEDMHISHHLERWSSGSTRETLNVQLGYLQMLDLDPRAVFPAPLKSPGKPKDRMGNRKRKNEICLRFDSAWSRNQTDRIVFENLVTRFSRDSFTINLDEGFLSRVIAYAQALYSFRKNLTPSVSDGGDGPSQTSIIHLHRMSISRLLMELTFIANSEVQESELLENPVLKMIAAVFANLRNASMIMTALEVNNATLTLTRLHMLVKDHYSGLVRAQIVSLVGSSAVLGNPLGLIKNIGTGVTDFFSKPLLAIKDNNIKDVPISLIEGTGSLVGNIVSGVGSSASGITDTIGRGMAVLSLDKEHQRRRAKDMKRNQPKEIVSGVFMGVGKVVEGVVRGVSGLVIDPVQETKKHGVAGFFKGVGKGILGVVTKPVGGAMDGVAKITQGVANTGKILRIEDKRRDNWHRQRAEEVRRTWEAHDGVDAPLPVFHETIAARGYMSLFGSNTGIRCPYVNIAFIDRFGRRWCVTHHNRLQEPLGVSHSDPSVDEQKFSIEYQDFQDLSSLQAKGTLHNSSRDIDEKKATRGGWVAISAYGTKSYIAVNARGFLVLAKKDKGGRLDSRFFFQIENLVPGFSSTTIREGRMGQLIHIEKAAKSTHLRAKPSSGVYAGNTFQLTLGSGSFVAFRNPFYKSVLTLDKIEASGSMNPKGNEKSAKLGMVRYPSGLKQTFKVVDWKQARSKESTFFPMPTMSFGRRWMPDQGVIRATYGWESKRVDVTAMITKLVSPDGHLKIPSSFDCTANFGVDPARGKPKELVVDYRRGLVTNRWTLPQKIRHKARMFVGKTARPSDILTRGVHLQWSIEAANVDGRAGFLVRSALNGACLSVGEDGAEVYVSDESEASGKSMSIGKEHLFQLIAAYPESKESITESDIKAAVNLIPLPPKRFPPTPKKTPSAQRSAVPRAPSGPSAPRGAAPAPPGPQGIPPGPPSSKPPLPFRRDMSKSARF